MRTKIILSIGVAVLIGLNIYAFSEMRAAQKQRDTYKQYVDTSFEKERQRIMSELEKSAKLRLWIDRNMDSLVQENKRLRVLDSLHNREIAAIQGKYKNKTSVELQAKMMEEYNRYGR